MATYRAIFWVTSLIAQLSYSAIIPPTTSNPNPGFTISESGTNWELTPPPPDSDSIKMLFRSKITPDNTQATLSIRVEKFEHGEKDLKGYLRRWIKEYPKFGYDVLGQKPFMLDGRPAYVVDLVSATTNKQARQVLSEKDQSVVLLTCLDQKTSFSTNLSACNTIIRNFKWEAASVVNKTALTK